MKNIKYLGMIAGAVLAAASAQANLLPISGSISFAGIATLDNAVLSSATTLTSTVVFVNTDSGDYATVPSNFGPTSGTFKLTSTGTASGTGTAGSPGLMSDYTFSPPQGAVTPLWAFTSSGLSYSFDATSMTAAYDSTRQVWNIGGSGIASITGFADTSGTWNASVGAQGGAFFFGSAATVPDGGVSVALLGGALTALSLVRSKLGKK